MRANSSLGFVEICKKAQATETGGSRDKHGPPFAATSATHHVETACIVRGSLLIPDLQHNPWSD